MLVAALWDGVGGCFCFGGRLFWRGGFVRLNDQSAQGHDSFAGIFIAMHVEIGFELLVRRLLRQHVGIDLKLHTRNLGGALGLALINTALDYRTDFHISRLHDKVTWGNAMAVETLNNLTQKFQGKGDAALMALKQLNQIVHRQAVVMSFGDSFFLLTLFYVALSTMVLLLSKPANPAAAGGGH